MIRCSAFCLTLDNEHSERVRAASARVDRIPHRFLVEDFGGGQALALPLERGRGLPLVHGWLAPEAENGEFSMVFRDGGAVSASRDSAGTRPLYVAKSGRWISSDHRFFPGEEAVMLAPGTTYDLSSGSISNLASARVEFRGSFEEAGAQLSALVMKAVGERVTGRKRVAVAFSGGLDSCILAYCARKRSKVVAVTVRTRHSRDSAAAPPAAEALGVDLREVEADARTVRRELSSLDLPFPASAMDKALWSMYSLASREAADAGAEVILLGQLADELFGGYAKYMRALSRRGPRDAASMMEADLLGCASRGFVRDEAACSRWLEPRFPFADRRILGFGRMLPVGFKVRGEERKAVLREAAGSMGLPQELCGTPKKAAQYSSGIQKVLD